MKLIKKKSQSQRMRAVLFRIWEKVGNGEFDDYYMKFMNDKIDKLKDYLGGLDG